jgi:hypothetical protein
MFGKTDLDCKGLNVSDVILVSSIHTTKQTFNALNQSLLG